MKDRHLFFSVLICVGLAIALGTACSSKNKNQGTASGGAESSPAFASKMQEFSAALHQLLPLVTSQRTFNDPANDAAILTSTQNLKKLSHQVKRLEKPSADPAFDPIATMLDEELGRALSALHNGNRDYARMALRQSIGYCIQCHTQTSHGPSFPKLDLGFDPSRLTPLARGDYYAATRQFDAAFEAYRVGVLDPAYAKSDVFSWEKAARSALAIAVRFREDPKAAMLIAKAVAKNEASPDSLKQSSVAWVRDIEAWAKEQPLPKQAGDRRLKRAEKLLAQAKHDASPDGEDILALRASADLHQWLSTHPYSKAIATKRAKALLLAGEAAAALREINFWVLHERYYEMCIETWPKSEVARKCFANLNDSVLLGYTGSSGLNLPADEAARLAAWKSKAFGP